jgi:outer membrane protein W
MKIFLLAILAVVTIISPANAQTEKGDWMIGGAMTISTATNNSQFALEPSAGYFFANNFVAGASFSLNFGKTGNQKTTSESVGPFARYYFNLKSQGFKPFLHAEYNIGNIVTKFPDSKSSNTVGNFLLAGGGAFFINKNVALEALAGFNHTKVQGLRAENGFLFRLGFQVYLLGSQVRK